MTAVNKPTFIDLFAGIGGFHLGMTSSGARCVFACEKDDFARATYLHNFAQEMPSLLLPQYFPHDLTKVDPTGIPAFDILCGGFPCQPFSQSGKKLGFKDTRGTLFFTLASILDQRRPAAFFLENVARLRTHDDGKTFETICAVLTQELGYSLFWKVIKGTEMGIPQHRPRIYLVGFKNKTTPFSFPNRRPLSFDMSDVLGGACSRKVGFTLRVGGRGSGISDRRNWDSYLVDGNVVRLTPEHGKRMQGFPSSFTFPVSEAQAMKQLGNSVIVPIVEAIGKEIVRALALSE